MENSKHLKSDLKVVERSVSKEMEGKILNKNAVAKKRIKKKKRQKIKSNKNTKSKNKYNEGNKHKLILTTVKKLSITVTTRSLAIVLCRKCGLSFADLSGLQYHRLETDFWVD